MAAPSFTWRSPPPYYFRNKTLSRETRSHCWFLNLWHFGRLKCPFLFCLAGAFFFARCFWGFPRRFASSSLSLSLFVVAKKIVAISLKVKTSINTRDQKKVHHRLLFTAVLFLHVHQGGRNDDKNARDEDTDGQCHAKFINVHNEN